MAIGRISGSVLKSNLTRNGVDLAFETNLLYLDVTNSRVGIGTSEPTTTLQVNGTTTTTGLTASGVINANGTGNSILVADTLRIAENGSGLRMTNVGAFDNNSGSFRIFSTNDLIFSSGGDSNTALTVDGSTQAINFNNAYTFPTSDGTAGQVLRTDGAGAVTFANPNVSDIGDLTATAAELNVLDGTTLGAANELCVVDPTGNFITTTSTLSIDQGNNYIGINQTSPEVTLHMTGEGAQTAQIRMEQYNDSADAPDVRTRRYRGTIASPSAIQSGDYLFRSNHEYYNGSALIVGGQFAFDNTNNANRTQFTVAVTTDGTSVEASSNDDVQFKIDGNDGGAITFNNAYKFPTADGSVDQFLKTDGSGNLSFATVSTNSISQLNSNVTVTDSGTGSITIDADGGTIITMNATTVLDASATTNAVRLPNGTTAQRPSGSVGMIRYNSSTDTIEGYTTAGGWAQLGATTATAENTDDTSTGDGSAISTTQSVIDQFVTSSFDSAWYLTVTRDEINDEVSTAKHSLVHNDTTAFVASSHITESDPTNAYLTAQADVDSGNVRLLGTGGSVVNSVSFYRIAVGDNTTAGTTGNVTTAINLDVDSAAEKIDGFALASARGAKYYISVNNTTTGELSNTEALVVHDGSNAYISQYGNVNTGNNDLITLTAEIDSTEVILKASAQAPNCRVTVYRILLADDESPSTGDNINVVEATSVDSGATTVDSFSTTAYTGAFYVFTGYNATEGAASIQEVMVVANDEAYVTQGPIVNSKGTDQLSFTASLSGTTVTVQAASTSGASTLVNGYRVHMLRGSAGASTADTVLVSTEQTITGDKTFSGITSLGMIKEGGTVSATASTGTINYDAKTQTVLYYTTDASGNWTINLRGDASNSMNSIMSTGQVTTVTFLATNGATPYYNSTVQVDGTTSGVTTKWQGGVAPSGGNADSVDVYTYSVIKTGDAAFTVLASVNRYA